LEGYPTQYITTLFCTVVDTVGDRVADAKAKKDGAAATSAAIVEVTRMIKRRKTGTII
jgi:hypothetical protein